MTGWDVSDPVQARLRAQYLDHLAAGAPALSRDGLPAHLTVGCFVLDEAREFVLLTLHAKARRWFQFGGHLEPGDRSVPAAARREAVEESGLPELGEGELVGPVQLDRHELPAAFGRCREHLDVRYAIGTAGRPSPVVSDESIDVRWWPVTALPEGVEPELAAGVALAIAALERH